MWSTCSMSTGHCSTQAPQVVHDQSTSGSMTPPSSSSPTSGLSVEPEYISSRSAITSSLGDSGFSVFQAGHCDWQRPHSVQVAKSSSPFQVKSVIVPAPNTASSAGSSKSTSSGSSGPSATMPDGLRLNQMLNGARNRCQATPIERLSAITANHAIDTTILTIATT